MSANFTYRLRQILGIILLILGTQNVVFTQDIYVDIQCSNQYPGVGEKIKLSYVLKLKMKGGMASISHNGIQVKKPDMKSLSIVEEGNEGNSFNFGGMGGGDMQVAKYSFILQPTKKGDVKIGPLTFTMNGNEYVSDSYTISVGAGDPKAKIVPQNSNFFVRIEVSKSELYQGEHALVTYKLYSHYSNISIQNYDFPMSNGLWREEISQGSGWPQTQENINGKAYLVIPLKKEIVYAQKTGEVQIPAFSVDLLVGGGFFSQGSKESITSNSPTLKVKSLPEGAPISFDNQVGKNYELEMSYSTNQLKSGEPIDVKIKISGDGNLRQMEAPQLSFPTDFKSYDPEIKDNIKLSTSGLSGYKEFNYLIIPQHHGTFEIPAFEYSYFDIASKSYKTLNFPSQIIEVAKGDGTNVASTNNFNSAKEDVEVLNNEVRHIALKTDLTEIESTFFGSKLFWVGVTLPFAFVLVGFLFLAFKPKEKDEALMAKKNASKRAFKTLTQAEVKLNQQNDIGFYEELYRGMLQYLSNKFGVATSNLTKEHVHDTLIAKSIPSEIVSGFIKILEECEMARFAPITHIGAIQTMEQAKEMIQNIERNAK